MKLLLAAAALLAGCATTPTAPKQLTDSDMPGIWCMLVTTLTTTVRTVYVQLGANPPPIEVTSECAVKVRTATPESPAAAVAK